MKATIWRELALAAGLVLFAGTLAFGANYLRLGNGQGSTASQSEKPSFPPTTSPVPPNGSALTGPVLPSEAEAILKARVTEINPVLVPTAVPSTAEAFVSADTNRYSVEYKTPSLDIVLASTGAKETVPGGTTQRFRRVQATYYVTDPAAPQEGQLLFWTEPSSLNRGGIRYFLKAGGMTAAQFWQLANSIRPLQ